MWESVGRAAIADTNALSVNHKSPVTVNPSLDEPLTVAITVSSFASSANDEQLSISSEPPCKGCDTADFDDDSSADIGNHSYVEYQHTHSE